MDAKIYSSDPNIKDVLNYVLQEYGFGKINYHSPEKNCLKGHDNSSCVAIVDTDSWQEHDDILRQGGVLLISSNPAKLSDGFKNLIKGVPIVVKPFSTEKLHGAINRIMLNDTERQLGLKGTGGEPLTGELQAELIEIEKAYSESRSKLEKILGSNPMQLKELFQSGALKPQDFVLKRVLVVELDPDFCSVLTKYLLGAGVFEVKSTSIGLEAWQMLSKEDFDMVILDWSIQDMPAVSLYNRIRGKDKLRYMPMLITLPKDTSEDTRLVTDDYCATLVKKPFQESSFGKLVSDVVVRSHLSVAFSKQVHSFLMSALEASFDFAHLKGPIRDFFAVSMRRVGQIMTFKGDIQQAEQVFRVAWQLGDTGITTLANLAKIFHLQKDHSGASDLIKKANVMGPGNPERLCLQGEIGVHMNDQNMAQDAFMAAFDTDRNHVKAKAGLEIVQSMNKNSDLLNEGLEANKGASPFNLMGIQLARSGRYKDALNYYRSALNFLHTKMDRAKLMFNIGLCYKRAGRDDKAGMYFQKSYQESGGEFTKPLDYIVDPNSDKADLEKSG